MISKTMKTKIDRAIKDIWLQEICDDYANGRLLKEASLQCSLYYHLRRRLRWDLEEHHLYVYPEFYFQDLKYFADIAIVQMDMSLDTCMLRDKIADVAAVIELKYEKGYSRATQDCIRTDIKKLKEYFQYAPYDCQCYFGVIYESDRAKLNWADRRTTGNWGKGRLTELNTGYLDGEMYFEVNSYNQMNYKNRRELCDIKW